MPASMDDLIIRNWRLMSQASATRLVTADIVDRLWFAIVDSAELKSEAAHIRLEVVLSSLDRLCVPASPALEAVRTAIWARRARTWRGGALDRRQRSG